MTINQVRKRLVSNNKKHMEFLDKHRFICKEAVRLIENEPDKGKRKEMIDFIFADKVEEVIEYHVRKEFLK